MNPRLLAPLTALLLCSTTIACDKKADENKTAEKKQAGKKEEAKKTEEAKPEEAKPEEAKVADKHFDVSADKSGVLARSAAVLETTDATSEDTALREHLAGLSHHAEAMSSDETLCKHVMELRKAEGQPEGDMSSCVVHFEHEVAILGPEIFSQMAQCILDSKTVADVDACEAAEKEAEAMLHDNKHGDGLSEEVCEQLFNKFEELSMADAGDHADFIKETLEGVKPDIMKACLDQGTQAEVDCAMKAADMDALSECQEVI